MDEIKNNWDYFKNKEFTPLQFDNPKFATIYDAIDIQYKQIIMIIKLWV